MSDPWPWYIAGPLIRLFVPILLLTGNRLFGVSANLRHLCAALAPGPVDNFRYAWQAQGAWNLAFFAGMFALVGGGVSVFTVTILAALAGTWTYGYLRLRLPA